jgi:hypothetical protein
MTCEKYKEYDREYKRKNRAILKLEFIKQYGSRCVDCGETEIMFLTLEHVAGDGQLHRKEVGNYTHNILCDLKRKGWPQDKYTLLCFNCNRKRFIDGKNM